MPRLHSYFSIISVLFIFFFALPAMSQDTENADGYIGTALELDGNLSYVEIVDSETINNITEQVTVSLWIKPSDIPNRYAAILHKGGKWVDGITHRSYVLNFKEGGFIQFAASPDSTPEASLYSPPNVIKLNTWHHIAGVIDTKNNSMKLFINGIEVGQRDFRGGQRLHKSQLPLRIGWSHENRPAKSSFVGSIDEVRVWNIARTGAEIRADMRKQLKGDEPGLVGYWKFDKETDGIVSDMTPNRNDNRLVGNSQLTDYVLPLPADAGPEHLANAAAVYEKLLTRGTNLYGAFRYLAEIYVKTGRTSDAEKVYLQALEADLTQIDHEEAIQALQKLNIDRDAVTEFITLLEKMQPNMAESAILYELLGDAYKRVGDAEKSEIAYAHWLAIRQKEIDIHKHASDYRLFAEDLFNKNIYPEVALDMATNALEIYSGSSYRIAYAHAVLMNEIYDQAYLILDTWLNSGYNQYIIRDLFSRIVKVGKNVKDKDGYVEMLDNLIDAMAHNLPQQLNTMLTLAQFYKENDMPDQATALIQQTGFAMEDAWVTLGPFDNTDGIGFRAEYILERLPKVDLDAQYDGLNGKVRWRKYTDDVLNGYISLKYDANWSVAYAYTTVHSPDERDVQFRFDSNDQGKIWVNGIEVHAHTRSASANIDRDIIPVTLSSGPNSILVKVCEEYRGSGFYLRITDKNGSPFNDLVYSRSEETQ